VAVADIAKKLPKTSQARSDPEKEVPRAVKLN
jgi:hypothetical protein